MKNSISETYSLDFFEGPLHFLLHLIHKNEINVSDIPIHQLIIQYMERSGPSVDSGAEFVGSTAFLLWLKSKRLLPKHHQNDEEEAEERGSNFDLVYNLLEYCRIKDAAKILMEREERRSCHHARGAPSFPEEEKELGIEHLSWEDFAFLFQRALEKAKQQQGKIEEDPWKVFDKIQWIQELLKAKGTILFSKLFSDGQPKGELIAIFLAVLELIKEGNLVVGKEQDTEKIVLCAQPAI